MCSELTVVVPTVDRAELLDRCLRGLAGQQGATLDVIVAHSGNPAIARVLRTADARLAVRGILSPAPGAAAKRNLGWRHATGPLVAFTDDDCEPAPGWAAAIVRAFSAPAAPDLVQGPVQAHPADAPIGGPFARTILVTTHTETYPTANLSVRRSALRRVGGFDERLQAGEDTDLAWRVLESGGRAVFSPDALVWHAVRDVAFGAHLRSLARWGDLPLVVRRHPQVRRLAYRRYLWKDTHLTALPAVFGLLVAPTRPLAALLPLAHLARRVRRAGLRDGAALAAADVVEVAVLMAGSVRHRSVLL